MRTRRRSALLALLLVACSTTSTTQSQSGSGARVPPPIPNGELYATQPAGAAAGTLLARQEIGAPDGMRAWAIAYASTGVHREAITVTGLVLAPASGTATPRPVVALGHWSVGIADPCAPSRRGIGPGGTVAVVGIPFVRAGDVVVATDYPGLGTPGTAAFLIGSLEGTATLDAARAARAIPEAAAGSRVALVGHSQGGQAALWAAQEASARAPDLSIVGVAAVSPVGDLVEIARAGFGSSGGRSPWINATELVASWSDLFGLDAAPILTDAGATLAIDLRVRCPGDVRVSASPVAANPLDDPAWRTRLTAESAGGAVIDAPVWISHGTADRLVPVASSRAVRDRLCALGGDVTLTELPGVDHTGAILGAGRVDAVVAWVQAGFAGERAPNGCG
jgi:pimeloyl-ACP methyl ester carboxylesterase